MGTITVRRAQRVLGCEIFGMPVTLRGMSDGLSDQFCNIAAVLAFGDDLVNGERVRVSDGARRREITVNFAEEVSDA
jgi:hypothetical protein